MAYALRCIQVVLVSLLASACAPKAATLSTSTISSAVLPEWATVAAGVEMGSPDLSRWWQQLDDPTLTSLIERAIASSPDLRTAQARLRQARAQRSVAAAELTPGVSASAGGSDRNRGPAGFNAGFDASWEPDIFGGARAGVDAAGADLLATAADLNAARVSLAAEVARNYVELRALQTRLDIIRRNEALQAETLELTEFRVQAGLVSSVDAEQARANLEQTRAQIPALEASIAQTIHRLSTLEGREPGALIGELSVVAPLPRVPERVVIGIPADTLRQRPDVRAAEARVMADIARVTQAGARRYPQFALSGSIGADVFTGALSGGTSFVSSIAGSIFQTVFDRGRLRQQLEIQSAIQEQAVANYDSTILRALEEVEDAIVAFEKSRERLASLQAAAEAANNARLLAQARYEAGLIDFQTLLDTQRAVLAAEDSVAATESERLTALIQLYKALGGGWQTTDSTLIPGTQS